MLLYLSDFNLNELLVLRFLHVKEKQDVLILQQNARHADGSVES